MCCIDLVFDNDECLIKLLLGVKLLVVDDFGFVCLLIVNGLEVMGILYVMIKSG